MRSLILGLALLGAAPAAALAQISPAAPDRNPPAAAMENSTRPNAERPVPGDLLRHGGAQNPMPGHGTTGAAVPNRAAGGGGADSATEAQARSRIEAAGFSGVTGLRRDDQGIWRGQALREGRQTSVALDRQGQVSAQ